MRCWEREWKDEIDKMEGEEQDIWAEKNKERDDLLTCQWRDAQDGWRV